MGDESVWAYPGDGEGPVHDVALAPFRIGRCTVTNREFATFVDATGHRTDAERFGWSFVFAGLPDDFPTPVRGRDAVVAARRRLAHPRPAVGHRIGDRGGARVVERRRRSAWSGTRLPTEAGGVAAPARHDVVSVGRRPRRGGSTMNVFQGSFPVGTPAPTATSARAGGRVRAQRFAPQRDRQRGSGAPTGTTRATAASPGEPQGPTL